MTMFGLLRVLKEGGTVLDMAPHLFPKELRESIEREAERQKEQGAQMQQLVLLKKLMERSDDS